MGGLQLIARVVEKMEIVLAIKIVVATLRSAPKGNVRFSFLSVNGFVLQLKGFLPKPAYTLLLGVFS